MQHVKIYQVDFELPREERDWMFWDWQHALDCGFNQDAYQLVYEYDIDDDWTLEHVFEQFNTTYADDYTGRSMSVSDVVELDGVPYYVDSIGFAEIEEDYWVVDDFN